jgi:hypothetical protein
MVKRIWEERGFGNLTAAIALFAAAVLVTLLSFGTSAPGARADGTARVEGPWSATTSVGLPVRFEVKEGNVVEPRFGFNWGECGSFEASGPDAPIDASGHWSSVNSLGQTIEATFVAPDRVEGTVVSTERELPSCPRTHATFVAAPGEVPPYVPPQVYAAVSVNTNHQSRSPREITLGKGLSFFLYDLTWQSYGKSVAHATGLGFIKRGKRRWVPRVSVRLSSLVADGPGKLLYSKLQYTLRGAVPKGFARRGSRTFG